jgi:hypothetical protein
MEYLVVKSGLAILDVARAYGLAQLLQVLAEGKASPRIKDQGGVFALCLAAKPNHLALKNSDVWRAVFADSNWQRVFLTYKKEWSNQRDRVKRILEEQATALVTQAEKSGLNIDFAGKFALPGPLDPVGFKGLKGLTAGSYSEGQTYLDDQNGALGCLGATIAQRYKIQKAIGNKWEYFVTVPVPEEVRFSDFHEIRQIVYDKGLSYNGVRNAAAHFSLLLANTIREKAQGNPSFPARFSSVLYFSLFQSGRQYKPSIGGAVNAGKLVEIALSQPKTSFELFKTWDYLFRRGSTRGGEDLAEAITDLVMAPSLETFYRHARLFNRYIIDSSKRVKADFLYDEAALKEVMTYAG